MEHHRQPENKSVPFFVLGPFYPDQLPLDRDNDLVQVAGQAEPARGIRVQLHGLILDARGQPLAGALVEIWQVDANGIYLHSRGGDRQRRDPGFQGYGRFTTGVDGRYRFRTIRPVAYPGRTPHIHLAVTLPGLPRFATQCYIRGEPGNRRDGLLNAIRDPRPAAARVADRALRAGERAGRGAGGAFRCGARRHARVPIGRYSGPPHNSSGTLTSTQAQSA